MATKLKILVVEDDKRLQDLYEKGLHEDLFEPRFATNGNEGLELYRSWRPDIMVLDVILPFMRGSELLGEIRETLGDTTTTIIAVTSLDQEDPEVRRLFRLGIQGYIAKPINHKTVSNKILKYFVHESPDAAGAVLPPLKVLIAEPHDDARATYRKGLSEAVFESRFVSDGREALDQYKAWNPQIIITELELPGLEGKDLARKILQETKDQTVTLIVGTLSKEKEDVIGCKRLGVRGYMVKPIEELHLASKVLKWFGETNPGRGKAAMEQLKRSLTL